MKSDLPFSSPPSSFLPNFPSQPSPPSSLPPPSSHLPHFLSPSPPNSSLLPPSSPPLLLPPPLPLPSSHLLSASTAEKTLLQLSGYKINEDIEIKDVPIYGNHYIHTIKTLNERGKTLVIVHGYGGSSITFYKMIKRLAKKFQVFCIDLLGMGLSSRPEFNCKTTEEAVNFFVNSIEEWRKALSLSSFFLCGHSLGGYVASAYTLKFPSRVLKLILLSPAGITGREEGARGIEEVVGGGGEEGRLNEGIAVRENSREEEDRIDLSKLGFWRRMFVKLMMKLWEQKCTPSKLFQKTGFLGRYILKLYITKRWNSPPSHTPSLILYFSSLLLLPPSSDLALFHILRLPRAKAKIPLEPFLKHLDKQILFLYGDRDWMDPTGAMRMRGRGKRVEIVQEAGHHVNIDNAERVCGLMEEFMEEEGIVVVE